MTTSRSQHINRYTFSHTDKLLFDANIWLLLFGPIGDPTNWRVRVYSKAYSRILSARSTICLDALVVSEFVNRFARLEHKRIRPTETPANFKTFRNSTDFTTVAKDIADTLRRIRSNVQCVDDGFASINLEAILVAFESEGTDINDHMIARLCREEGITLITDDADFKNLDVVLLTANDRLLH